MSAKPSTNRSRLPRLRVKLRRALRPTYEVLSFLGAGLTAIFQLLTGRLPSPARKIPKAQPDAPRPSDHTVAPFPIEE